ncbi:cytochrome P450 [Kitasatospora sp. GP82]|uniref:cytochrome P450 n=1 Tax=Kitasatospora sp. GP82 TaxID=3035089 RepID=UPI0024733596|nr:cytochrome P450 [Kitasatospora sp. GP82]
MGSGSPRRLYGPEAEADPRGLYEKLRAEYGPVAPVLLHGEIPVWLVLGYQENLVVARTPSRFSKDSRLWNAFREGWVKPDSPLLPVVGWQELVAFADGEEHRRLRRAVTDSLEAFDRRGIRRYVARFADQLVDNFAAAGTADLVSQFAEHLPLLVMTQLLGMPENYGSRMVEAVRDLLKGTETAVASNGYIVKMLEELIESKRINPGKDLPSWLLQHEAGLNNDELVEHLRLILVAGNETTVNLIADGLRMVLTDRRFRLDLTGGQMTLPDALERVLWDSPPLLLAPGRYATGDTDLGGQRIKEGDMVVLGLAAGNVDPQIRPDGDRALYGNRSHLAFGAGPHECPGQDIGRAIAQEAIDRVLVRLPDLQLAVDETDLSVAATWMASHLRELPVEFTPRPRKSKDARGAAGVGDVPPPGKPESAYAVAPEPAATPDTVATRIGSEPRRTLWDVLTGLLRRQ